jgi:hypothetical protein
VERVIRALAYLKKEHPRNKKIARALKYFRRNRGRMNYAVLAAENLPIGTGIVEAACKTILTFRALVQSNRFESAWKLLKAVYVKDVKVPENVIALNAR